MFDKSCDNSTLRITQPVVSDHGGISSPRPTPNGIRAEDRTTLQLHSPCATPFTATGVLPCYPLNSSLASCSARACALASTSRDDEPRIRWQTGGSLGLLVHAHESILVDGRVVSL